MYDIDLRKELKDATVGEIIDILNTLPRDCKANFNGDNYGYIHIEEDKSAMSFDDSSLDDDYDMYEEIKLAGKVMADVIKRNADYDCVCVNDDVYCKCRSCKHSKVNKGVCSHCIKCIDGEEAMDVCDEHGEIE